MKRHPTRLIASTILLALAFGSAGTFAQPPENRGKPEAHAGKHAQHPGNKSKGAKSDNEQYDHSERYQERDNRHVSIEEAVIRGIFRDQRSYIEPVRSLPPGIRKNLARGKPLPPGIAKQFDSRVQSRLPNYPGYDWRQVGTDAVLIDATTGVIEAIIANVLQ